MKTSIYGAVLAATIALGGVAQAAELKISHVRPQDTTIDKEVRVFADAVAKATGDDVTIRVFPASALGDYTTVQERISVGAVDMAVQPAATAADRQDADQLVPLPRRELGPGPQDLRPRRSRAQGDGRAVRQAGHHHAGRLSGLFRRHRPEPRRRQPRRSRMPTRASRSASRGSRASSCWPRRSATSPRRSRSPKPSRRCRPVSSTG